MSGAGAGSGIDPPAANRVYRAMIVKVSESV